MAGLWCTRRARLGSRRLSCLESNVGGLRERLTRDRERIWKSKEVKVSRVVVPMTVVREIVCGRSSGTKKAFFYAPALPKEVVA